MEFPTWGKMNNMTCTSSENSQSEDFNLDNENKQQPLMRVIRLHNPGDHWYFIDYSTIARPSVVYIYPQFFFFFKKSWHFYNVEFIKIFLADLKVLVKNEFSLNWQILSLFHQNIIHGEKIANMYLIFWAIWENNVYVYVTCCFINGGNHVF